MHHLRSSRAGASRRSRCRGFLTELIERAGRGDEESLGRLVDLLQPLVLAAARRRFPDRAPDEVAVEVFLRVWQLAPTYDRRREGPVTWILRQVAEVHEPTVALAVGA